jgi:acyl-CoA reductase-like NAD-dependent aldehyde dehydrogenase
MGRLKVSKTYKLFIGGQFPRSESGRYYPLFDKKQQLIANVCLSSRKDLRNAVVAAREAFAGWSSKTAFNRGQILYRIAEMVEGRKNQFVEELISQGMEGKKAQRDVETAIDRLVYYSGWCDKFQTLFSSVNPVASPHFNFSYPEPTGVVSAIINRDSALSAFVGTMAPCIVGGNTIVMLASERFPLSAISFAEVLSTSDLPAGVVNILTGKKEELLVHFSSHMDVNAFVFCEGSKTDLEAAGKNCSLNVKRMIHWNKDFEKRDAQSPYFILDLQEIKTTWHPIEMTGGSGQKY